MTHWRTFGRMALSIVLVASLTFILVHWHSTTRGQDCGICSVHHIPAVLSAHELLLVVPLTPERIDTFELVPAIYSAITAGLHDRAPPQVFSSL